MSVEILTGDCRNVLPTLPENSVQCVVTSPPYFGLRDYGTAQWDGGNPDCDHKQGRSGAGRADGKVDERGQRNRDGVGSMGGDCRKCGAIRIDRQIGLEPTVDAYVAELVAVFREVRRVLRDDGTCWINLGDSYATNGGAHTNGSSDGELGRALDAGRPRVVPPSLKPKDLIGVPWRVAFALQADGWYLRQDIIWSKPNPMPESVTDRCTKSHEYLFLLTKSARYFYDAAAIREPNTEGTLSRLASGPVQAFAEKSKNRALRKDSNDDPFTDPNGRNKRSVWTIATQPYSDAHFATYPEALVEPCILAGSREGDTILDPFGGSGTTGRVATRLNRRAILIELNPEYIAMIERRTAQRGLDFAGMEVPA